MALNSAAAPINWRDLSDGSPLQRECPEIEQPDVVAALTGFDALWESLFPAEQARIARLLVERVTVGSDGMAVDLRTEGLGSVVREMVTPRREMAA